MIAAATARKEPSGPEGTKGRRGRWLDGAGGWLVVFMGAGLLYILTLAPDVVWQDQGDYQYQVARLGLNRPGDVVRVHPLFIVTAHYVGRLGWFSYAYAANLVSALFGAVTVANVYLLVRRLTRCFWAGLIGAGVLALGHSMWFLSVQAQTYSMALAALSGGLLLARAYCRSGRAGYLWGMGLVFGLGVSAHLMSQIAFAVLMVWVLALWRGRRLAGRQVLLIVGFWAVGALLLWVAVGLEYQRSGDLAAALQSAVWGRWGRAVFNVGRIGMLLKKSVGFFALNFPTPLVLLAAGGVYYSFKRRDSESMRWLLLASLICYALFACRYDVPNQNNFFLPMYLLVSIYVGLGFGWVAAERRRLPVAVPVSLALLGVMPVTYALLADYAAARQIDLGTRRHIPYRNVYHYYLQPWQQGQTGPRRFVTELFAALPANAVVLADSTTLAPLRYVHEVEGARPDVAVQALGYAGGKADAAQGGGRRVFTISDVKGYYPPWVKDKSRLKPFAISGSEHVFEIMPPGERRDDPTSPATAGTGSGARNGTTGGETRETTGCRAVEKDPCEVS